MVENANEGTDTVYSWINYTLGANVENLTLLGGATGVGNTLNNVINGNGNNNSLDGGAGNDTLSASWSDDTLIGGTGNDTLRAEAGNDTYVFNRGDGLDTVYDDYRTYSQVWVQSGYWYGACVKEARIMRDASSDDELKSGHSVF